MRLSTLVLLSLVVGGFVLAGCAGGESKPPASATQAAASATKSATAQPAGTKAAATKAAAVTPAAKGDGTLKIKLNLLNPEKKQARYSVFFTPPSVAERGQALSSGTFLGPFAIDTAGELVLNVEKDLKTFLLRSSGLGGPMSADLVVTRVEDTHVRNPLSKPLTLTFDEDLRASDRGNAVVVDVTDSALNDLYPQEVFLVKIVPADPKAGGGYPNITYKKSGSSLPVTMGRGSAGPDFLVAFPVADFKKAGVREATLTVVDENNKSIGESMPLTFDENGRCQQGALVTVKTNR